MSIYDGLKDAAGILKEAGKIEQYRQILEAQEKMLEMQKRIYDLETENADLENKLNIKTALYFENNVYWKSGNPKEGPFCSRCWDSEQKLIRMHTHGPSYHKCLNCGHAVQTGPDLPQPKPYYPNFR